MCTPLANSFDMKKNTLLWVLGYGIVAYGTYYLFFSKSAYISKIVKAGKYSGSTETLKSFDMGFLREWAKAATSGANTFMYQGKNYNTLGGKAVK